MINVAVKAYNFRSNLPWWAGEIKVCILEKQFSINPEDACELEGRKKKSGAVGRGYAKSPRQQ